MQIFCKAMGELSANCYMAADEVNGTAVLIDPGCVCRALDEMLNDKRFEITHIILTHRHFDHINGAAYAKEKTGAKLCIHRLDSNALTDGEISLSYNMGLPQQSVSPDIILDDGDEIKSGDLTFRVIHTPGHTIGSITLLCGDAMFSGDTLFSGSVGRMDLPTGSERQMRESIRRLRELDGDYHVYPGHGRATTLDRERKTNTFMV